MITLLISRMNVMNVNQSGLYIVINTLKNTVLDIIYLLFVNGDHQFGLSSFNEHQHNN